MFAKVVTVAFEGVEARRVDVEVTATHGQQGSFQVVGLGDKAVAESRERVRGALAGIGLAFPAKRVVANLAPADLPKEGSHFDLPIALALLASMGVLPVDALDGWVAVGELGLDGQIAAVSGALPAAVAAAVTVAATRGRQPRVLRRRPRPHRARFMPVRRRKRCLRPTCSA